MSPFRLKNYFAYKRNKANLDPFHMCFTISLLIFTSLFSLRFDLVIFALKRTKRSEIQVYFFVFFAFFHFFSHFFKFFSLFSLNFRFASKRNKIFASISNFASEAKVRAHPTPDPDPSF